MTLRGLIQKDRSANVATFWARTGRLLEHHARAAILRALEATQEPTP